MFTSSEQTMALLTSRTAIDKAPPRPRGKAGLPDTLAPAPFAKHPLVAKALGVTNALAAAPIERTVAMTLATTESAILL